MAKDEDLHQGFNDEVLQFIETLTQLLEKLHYVETKIRLIEMEIAKDQDSNKT